MVGWHILVAAVDWIVILLHVTLGIMMFLVARRHPLERARQITGAAGVMFVLFAFQPIVDGGGNSDQHVFYVAITAIVLLYLTALLADLVRSLDPPPGAGK